MIALIGIELYKIFKKARTYIAFGAIGLVTVLFTILIYFNTQSYAKQIPEGIQSQYGAVDDMLSGYIIAYGALGAMAFLLPLLITFVPANLLAGEANSGTFRMILARPVSRVKLVTIKFIAGLIYTFLLILFLAVLSMGLGLLVFGGGDFILFQNDFQIFKSGDILWRFALAYSFIGLAMSVITSLAFMLSSFTKNAIGPVIATMSAYFGLIIISAFDFDVLNSIKQFFFTTALQKWEKIFFNPIDFTEIIYGSLILLAHIVVFFAITLYFFRRKDILT